MTNFPEMCSIAALFCAVMCVADCVDGTCERQASLEDITNLIQVTRVLNPGHKAFPKIEHVRTEENERLFQAPKGKEGKIRESPCWPKCLMTPQQRQDAEDAEIERLQREDIQRAANEVARRAAQELKMKRDALGRARKLKVAEAGLLALFTRVYTNEMHPRNSGVSSANPLLRTRFLDAMDTCRNSMKLYMNLREGFLDPQDPCSKLELQRLGTLELEETCKERRTIVSQMKDALSGHAADLIASGYHTNRDFIATSETAPGFTLISERLGECASALRDAKLRGKGNVG